MCVYTMYAWYLTFRIFPTYQDSIGPSLILSLSLIRPPFKVFVRLMSFQSKVKYEVSSLFFIHNLNVSASETICQFNVNGCFA